MEYQHIERLLGLHEELHIIYVVDGFYSQFYTDDGNKEIMIGEGKTVKESLIDLNGKLALIDSLGRK